MLSMIIIVIYAVKYAESYSCGYGSVINGFFDICHMLCMHVMN